MNHITYCIGLEQDRDGIKYDSSTAVARAQIYLTKIFGGLTWTEGLGTWTDVVGNLVIERSARVEIFTSAEESIILGTAEWLATEFNQSSVLVSITKVDRLELVEGKYESSYSNSKG